MVTCSAIGCTNRSGRRKPGLTFHSFPADHKRRFQWKMAVRRANWEPSVYSKLCSDHFIESDFIKINGRVRLNEHAIPSIFKGFPHYLQMKEKKSSSNVGQREEASKISDSVIAESVEPLMPEPNIPGPSTSCSVLLNESLMIESDVEPLMPDSNTPGSSTSCSILLDEFSDKDSSITDDGNKVNEDDSQPKEYYKWQVQNLKEKCRKLTSKLKAEREKNRRYAKKIDHFTAVFKELKKKQLLMEDSRLSLISSSEQHAEFFAQIKIPRIFL